MEKNYLENDEKIMLIIKGFIYFALLGIVIYFDIKTFCDSIKLMQVDVTFELLFPLVSGVVFETVIAIGLYVLLLERRIKKLKS